MASKIYWKVNWMTNVPHFCREWLRYSSWTLRRVTRLARFILRCKRFPSDCFDFGEDEIILHGFFWWVNQKFHVHNLFHHWRNFTGFESFLYTSLVLRLFFENYRPGEECKKNDLNGFVESIRNPKFMKLLKIKGIMSWTELPNIKPGMKVL